MKLINVLRKECIAAEIQFENKTAAFGKIIELAKKCPILKDVSAEEIDAGLKERESLGSTGFGNGIAIPHCHLKNVSEFVVGFITVPDGVDFDALDGKKVELIAFIIAPEGKPNKHIKLLSAISQALLIPGAIKELLSENTAEAIYESFLRHTRADIDTTGGNTKNLLHIFVQDEKLFQEIFEKVANIESSSLVVVNAENAARYLAKTPLFAGFWRDDSSKFSKVILATVEKKLTNEAIRLIESVTGDLKEKTGVMVTVQEISYAAGVLNAQG